VKTRHNLLLILAAALTVGGTLFLAGCYQTPTYIPVSYTPPPSGLERGVAIKLTPQQIQVVKAGVAEGMKDPESARFSGEMLAAKNSKGIITVCGYVNGKNSYGGYVGKSPFVGVLGDGKFVLVDIGSSQDDRKITAKVCDASGVDGIM
jgi:hypothetical protein